MKSHLKRLAAPKTWPIKRKGETFITRPNPSGSPINLSIPLSTAFKELLNIASTTKEVKHILHNNETFIDNKRVYNHNQSVGLFGVVSIPALKLNYRLSINDKNKLFFIPIISSEANKKPLKIINKKSLTKGKIQLNCLDGHNILIENNNYSVGDTIIIDLKTKKIIEHIPFDKESLVILYRGKHVGLIAKVKEFTSKEVTLDKENIETKKEYCFVIGKDKPVVTIIV